MVTEIPMDEDVQQLLEPKLPDWLPVVDESKEVVISRRIFDRLSIPRIERLHPNSLNPSLAERGAQEMEVICGMYSAEPRNLRLFQAGTHMPWHTNSDVPGTRIYFVYNEEPGSAFKYRDPDTGRIETIEEPVGWSAKQFVIPEQGFLWHAVFAAGIRLCVGLLVPEEDAP